MPDLKILVQCAACSRQFDAFGLDPGSRFHCSCGGVLVVPRVDPRSSAVVRCGACGGARRGDETSCGFCGADFTLHERDLVALCPGCATRLPGSARYCHGCGRSIDLGASRPGSPSDRVCPACGDGRRLRSRRLGEIGAAGEEGRSDRQLGAVLECPRCAGLWIAADAFARLERRARDSAALDAALAPDDVPPPSAPGAGGGPLYKPCVVCGQLMNRRNYARRSGVVIDTCRDHGMWFDERELEAILHWIRRGGWQREEERRAAEEVEEERRRARRRRDAASWPGDRWVTSVLGNLFDL